MSADNKQIIIDVAQIITATAAILKVWADTRVNKKDIDGVAKVVGTERSKGPPRPDTEIGGREL